MERKRICKVVLLGAALALFLPSVGWSGGMKVGYVNIRKALWESKKGKAVKKEIEARGAALDKIFKQKQEELRKLKESLDKKILSEKARKEKEKEYQKKLKELDRFVKDSRDELRQMEREKTTKLLKVLEKVVKKIGKEKGYTLILESGFILYAPDSIDLTDEVIKAFDAAKE